MDQEKLCISGFIDGFVECIRDMIQESNRRMREGRVLGKEALLRGGIWYASAYYQAARLREKKAVAQWQDAFFHGAIPSELAHQIPDPKSPTGIKPLCFILKKGVLPSTAVLKIEEGISFLDCATFVALALYKALLKTIGTQTFDRLFAEDSPHPFRLSLDALSPLTQFVLKQPIASEKQVKKGDICYFSNIVDYIAKHPAGTSRGYHQVCINENPHLYVGMGLSHQGFDKERMERELWDCFNQHPLDRAFLSPTVWNYLYSHYYQGDVERGRALVDSFSTKKLSWQEFQKKPSRISALGLACERRMGLWVYRVDLDRIRSRLQSIQPLD